MSEEPGIPHTEDQRERKHKDMSLRCNTAGSMPLNSLHNAVSHSLWLVLSLSPCTGVTNQVN